MNRRKKKQILVPHKGFGLGFWVRWSTW